MNDLHPENNKIFAELAGIPWDTHEGRYGNFNKNPNYAADPRLVLREMRKRKDFNHFLRYCNGTTGAVEGGEYAIFDVKYEPSGRRERREEHYKYTKRISVSYILDETGKLRDAAIEFLKEEEAKDE